jgi:hypothetical protein
MDNQLNQQDLIDRGVRAEELLKNDTFASAVKDVVDMSISTWLNSKDEDGKLRESAYYAAQGINNVVGVLNQYVAIKEQIVAELNQQNEE